MPAFLIPWLFRLGALIAVGLFVYGLWWKVDHWCNSSCKDATARAEVAEEAITVARERATALALLWAKAIDQVQVVYRDKVVIREKSFNALRERVGQIRSDVLVPLDAPTIGVLADAERLANPTDPAPPGGDRPAPQEVPVSAWVEFAVNAAEAYRDAADKHLACVAWANSISTHAEAQQSPPQSSGAPQH